MGWVEEEEKKATVLKETGGTVRPPDKSHERRVASGLLYLCIEKRRKAARYFVERKYSLHGLFRQTQ